MDIEFHIRPVGHTLAVVGTDGRVYGGVRRGLPESVEKAERLLEIVERAHSAGGRSAKLGTWPDFGIRQGSAPEGRGRTWEIVDVAGTVFGAVGKGLWPKPGKDARKLLETVEHASGRGRNAAFDAMVRRGRLPPEATEASGLPSPG